MLELCDVFHSTSVIVLFQMYHVKTCRICMYFFKLVGALHLLGIALSEVV
jgi:hypothetical protein